MRGLKINMFKKLVSNLPFNPGLMHQIAFYGKRLNKEKSLRRASFGFMAATLVVNILAISSPAQNPSKRKTKKYNNDP
jgi:hypothetical protein